MPIAGPPLSPGPPGRWQTFASIDGLPSANISDLAVAPDGGVWVSTTQGTAFFDGRSWQAYSNQNGMPDNGVMTVEIGGDGSVWFGGENWVSRFYHNEWSHFTQQEGLQKGFVLEMARSSDSGVWVGITGAGDDWAFGNGAAHISAPPAYSQAVKIQSFLPTNERIGGGLISAIAEVGETMWFAVNPEGTHRPGIGPATLWRLSGWQTVTERDDQWDQLDTNLTEGQVISTLESGPDGELWIGTSAGLLRIPPQGVDTFSISNAQRFSREMGLPSDRILSLAVSHNGRVAVGTEAGLAVMTGSEIEVYSTGDGLPDNTVRAVGISQNGEIWVGTPLGVGVLRPD
ncbi:MAG: two-component regulator propeller domain-containing protein [Anaerolineales bacterium]|nr:two-component regulator propeller domain-containing protein [Anaerolineales bacterium]